MNICHITYYVYNKKFNKLELFSNYMYDIFALILLRKWNKWNLFLSAPFWHFSKGDTTFSTLFQQFHKALTRH